MNLAGELLAASRAVSLNPASADLLRFYWLQAMALDRRVEASAVRLGVVLASHADIETGECESSQEDLATELDCNTRTVRRGIASLEAADF